MLSLFLCATAPSEPVCSAVQDDWITIQTVLEESDDCADCAEDQEVRCSRSVWGYQYEFKVGDEWKPFVPKKSEDQSMCVLTNGEGCCRYGFENPEHR